MSAKNAAIARRKLGALYQLWLSRRGDDLVPRRAAFQPEDFKPWMGHVSILELVGSPRRFRMRLIGTEVVHYDGADFTGRMLDEVLRPTLRDVILRQYHECADTGRPLAFSYASQDFRGVPATVHKLFLPLSHDGTTLSQIMNCIYADFGPIAAGQPTLQDYETDGRTITFDPAEL